MLFATTTFLSLLTAAAAVNPFLTVRDFPPVGFGQELQNSDQANHWVSSAYPSPFPFPPQRHSLSSHPTPNSVAVKHYVKVHPHSINLSRSPGSKANPPAPPYRSSTSWTNRHAASRSRSMATDTPSPTATATTTRRLCYITATLCLLARGTMIRSIVMDPSMILWSTGTANRWRLKWQVSERRERRIRMVLMDLLGVEGRKKRRQSSIHTRLAEPQAAESKALQGATYISKTSLRFMIFNQSSSCLVWKLDGDSDCNVCSPLLCP